jgi:hypothetical protein
MVTNVQLCLMVGVPILGNAVMCLVAFVCIKNRFDRSERRTNECCNNMVDRRCSEERR